MKIDSRDSKLLSVDVDVVSTRVKLVQDLCFILWVWDIDSSKLFSATSVSNTSTRLPLQWSFSGT